MSTRIKPPLYDTWTGMRARCSKPSNNSYQYYGAKGIRVCARWSSFRAFAQDMGERPAGHTLDRIDNAKDYSPENCRWATVREQNSHKGDTRLYSRDGTTAPLREWARRAGLSYQVVHNRITKLGLPLDLALTLPVNRRATMRALQEIR